MRRLQIEKARKRVAPVEEIAQVTLAADECDCRGDGQRRAGDGGEGTPRRPSPGGPIREHRQYRSDRDERGERDRLLQEDDRATECETREARFAKRSVAQMSGPQPQPGDAKRVR